MKITELRIGNLFNGYDNKYFAWVLDDFEQIALGIDEIIKEPIHITDEWLIKFGCEKLKNNRWSTPTGFYDLEIQGDKVAFVDWSEDAPAVTSYFCHSEFVHEFQNNYLALEKEEIELLKT